MYNIIPAALAHYGLNNGQILLIVLGDGRSTVIIM